MLFTTFFATLLLAASSSLAAPINSPQELIVFNPPITSPKASAAWPMGSKQVVRWDIAEIPESRINTTGVILLGHMTDGTDEHLDIEHPLATGFPIKQGFVEVTMPQGIDARDDYFVVLFGDSGNKSPKFKIHH
ncbi:hypothetical protein D9613_005678 [Agrocybe pediades]|uniref:Uncharacterized protein n=1 Tax=Agrocybe pediades TaxID=84607 RepID=A0A8H4VPL3_9AGAR|nr:hypothetical protein D9613_005678 [Agrocybe pediades]KAF9555328.1 hypothetical protein CPC08DRAFT_821162 [Agrocybe pediades]